MIYTTVIIIFLVQNKAVCFKRKTLVIISVQSLFLNGTRTLDEGLNRYTMRFTEKSRDRLYKLSVPSRMFLYFNLMYFYNEMNMLYFMLINSLLFFTAATLQILDYFKTVLMVNNVAIQYIVFYVIFILYYNN